MKQSRGMLWAAAAGLMAAACSPGDERANEAAQANAQSQPGINAMDTDPNNPFARAEAEMLQRMMDAAGADPSETWIRKMIEHHRGAIAMAGIVLAQNPTPEVRAQAQQTRRERAREIEALERMLQPEAAAAQPTPADGRATASPPAAPARPGAAASPAPKPPPRAAPPPTDPHAGHDMNEMNHQ